MADDRDIIDLAYAKRVLRISGTDTSKDDLLAGYITASSRMLDRHAGHTVAYSVTDELHDGTNASGRGYRQMIILRHRPVIEITAVSESGVVLTDSDWMAGRYDPDPTLFSGIVRRRAGDADAWWNYGRDNLSFTYTAGRSVSTGAVDERFQRACAIVLENLWRDREPSLETMGEYDVPRQSFPTFAMPNAVKHLLSEEMGQNKTFGIA